MRNRQISGQCSDIISMVIFNVSISWRKGEFCKVICAFTKYQGWTWEFPPPPARGDPGRNGYGVREEKYVGWGSGGSEGKEKMIRLTGDLRICMEFLAKFVKHGEKAHGFHSIFILFI